jgi:hypothetical protein
MVMPAYRPPRLRSFSDHSGLGSTGVAGEGSATHSEQRGALFRDEQEARCYRCGLRQVAPREACSTAATEASRASSVASRRLVSGGEVALELFAQALFGVERRLGAAVLELGGPPGVAFLFKLRLERRARRAPRGRGTVATRTPTSVGLPLTRSRHVARADATMTHPRRALQPTKYAVPDP